MSNPPHFQRIAAAFWQLRRWLFGAYVAISCFRIPARTGFRMHTPACDTELTAHNAALSMTKVPHLIMFGVFGLFVMAMFDRSSKATVLVAVMATAAMGLLVELEEGATQTGYCRLTDVLPDIVGATIASMVVLLIVAGIAKVRARNSAA